MTGLPTTSRGQGALRLLLARRFAPLFWCQFFAAFDDNFLKTSLVFLILFSGRGDADAAALVTAASAIFIAPYFFLSALGGELADRHDKARVAQVLKLVEIVVAGVAVAGFLMHSLAVLFTALAGFGVLAALFGPVKYGLLPDHLTRTELPAGNAMIEGATFIAILAGTIVGGLAARDGGHALVFSALVMGVAVLCWLASLLIPSAAPGAPGLAISVNIFAATWRQLRALRADARLWWGAMVTSWFWLTGIVVLSLLPPLIKTVAGGNENTVTAFLAIFSVAVGVGSALAAALARGRIVLRITLIGAVLLAGFMLDLAAVAQWHDAVPELAGPVAVFSTVGGIRIAVDLAGLAVAGGLFIVPAFAAVQAWSDVAARARTIAAVNILNAAFMTGATVTVALLQKAGVGLGALFLLLGVSTLIVAALIRRTMPAGD